MDYGDGALDPFTRSERHIPIVTEVDEDAKPLTSMLRDVRSYAATGISMAI